LRSAARRRRWVRSTLGQVAVNIAARAGAHVTGVSVFPLSEIPFHDIVDRVVAGAHTATPAKVFRFEDIQEAHRLLEPHQACGKIVVRLWLAAFLGGSARACSTLRVVRADVFLQDFTRRPSIVVTAAVMPLTL
jgi:hypothetical protein